MLRHHRSLSGPPLRERENGGRALLLLALFFLAGCFMGSVFGNSSQFPACLSDFPGMDALGKESFWPTLLSFSKFHIAAFLLGSTYYGALLLPFLCCLRGYAFSRTAAVVVSVTAKDGFLTALIVLGIPALFSLTCFFVLSLDAFLNARRVLDLVCEKHSPKIPGRLLRAALCVPVLLCGNAVSVWLVPKLVSLLH